MTAEYTVPDELAIPWLALLTENFERQREALDDYQLSLAMDQLTSAMRFETARMVALSEQIEQTKRSRKECDYFYRWISAANVGEFYKRDAETALSLACEELGLGHLGLQLKWFDNRADQEPAREAFRSGDLEIFSYPKGMRGFVSWTQVLTNSSVNLASQYWLSPVGQVTAHECRHVWQRVASGRPEEPSSLDMADLERDAVSYAEHFWERHRERFY